MKAKILFRNCLFLLLLVGLIFPAVRVQADAQPVGLQARAADGTTAYDLIVAMNSLRVSNGLPALVEDPIIDAVAQSTAQTMANSQMSWHIGDVSGRLAAAGYGGGSKVWATENFAVGNQSIDEIMIVWSDESHMLPAVIAAYCNVGAGTAQSANGMTYYILQAAYTAGKACGEYTSSGGTTTSKTGSTTSGNTTGGASNGGVSQIVMPVKIATPDADGKIFHVVQAGQSFWSIAIAYKITIKDLKTWNNLSEASNLKMGQKLFIPSSNTAGYATPTQAGAIQLSTPDQDGRIMHVVQSYQTLSTIAIAYGITVDKILAFNGLRTDWPLQIGQKLLIDPGNVTPSPTLLPIQRLTPDSDGNYYHIVRSGETLSWIAGVYGVRVNDIMVWNGLSDASIISINQKLLLKVTPPVTETETPLPPTVTSTPEPVSVTPTVISATASPAPLIAIEPGKYVSLVWIGLISIVVAGLGVALFWLIRKKPGDL